MRRNESLGMYISQITDKQGEEGTDGGIVSVCSTELLVLLLLSTAGSVSIVRSVRTGSDTGIGTGTRAGTSSRHTCCRHCGQLLVIIDSSLMHPSSHKSMQWRW